MLTQERAREIFEIVRRHSTGDGVEAIIAGGRSALTRFANNTIHQNMAEEQYQLSVRVLFGQRTARATSNKLDEESIRRVVQAAENLARVQQPDPDLLPLAAPELATGGPAAPARSFPATSAMTPEERAAAVDKIVAVARRNQLTTAGVVASSHSAECILNSQGLFAWHEQTLAEVSITMLGEDSSGWQKATSPDLTVLDPEMLAEIAARKAMQSAHPRELAPGKYTVILEPAAVLDLMGFMFFDFGGQAILDQRSFLNNRLGTQVFGENITIYDDVYHPLQAGSPFDGEGVCRKRVQLVVRGGVKNLVYARHTAEKMKKSEYAARVGRIEPTGHGLPLPNEMGEAPMHIVMDSGPPSAHRTVEQMIAETERGVLVTRLWYIREVDPYEKILTGMTRDGTFYIEQGRVRHGIRNFRFNESLVRMLNSVEAMSAPVRSSGEESFDMVVPAMKVKDFNFTEVTKF
ncbi:MAG TPA: TldD/PmbA family protein [Terriglobales bacterium]|nr:TldD/PmbA family protein [Terriglobales bacterium]